MDLLGFAIPQTFDKSTLTKRLRRVKQIDVDIIFLVLRLSIGFKSSFLLTKYYSAQISLYPAKKDAIQGLGQFQALATNFGVNMPKNNQDFYRTKCSVFLTKLNQLLECNEYLLTNNLLFVDIAIVPFIRQCAYVDIYWFQEAYIKLSNWLNNIIESELFVSVMYK